MTIRRLLVLLGLFVSLISVCRAGMTIYSPSQAPGWFTIYYGLGSPQPGKVAYVYVTEPNGYYHEVAEAENVPDKSQVTSLYGQYPGTYRFYYCYSYYSAGVGFTQVYEEDHYIATANGAPYIQWYTAPDSANDNTQYYIQAQGWDNDGNLSQVNVWKNGNPFAFAGGGNGFNNTSGNPSTDAGEQYITYSAQSVDATGLTSSMIYHTVHVLPPPNSPPSVSWDGVTPSYVDHNAWYTVRANGTDPDRNMNTINIYKDGNPFAFELNGNGSSAYSDNPVNASEAAGTDLTYSATAGDGSGAWSGTIYRTVHVNNYSPIGGWNPYDVGTVYINGQYGSTASAGDQDGNLKEIRVYKSSYEYMPDGSVTSSGPTLWDRFSSPDGNSASKSYTWQADTLYKYKYVWSMIAEDNAGATSLIWSISGGGSGEVDTQNRQPLAPTLVSQQTTIQLNQTVTVSGNGSDQDANATFQYLWYQRDGETTWHSISSSQYASGTGNTVINFVFDPTALGLTPGLYHLKTRVDDPYASSVDVTVDLQVNDVPPNAPTGLAVTQNTPRWVYLSWTISSSNNVTEQHVYWQPSGGGTVTDILVGGNVAGTSVTGLSPGTGYNFWVKARNGFGTYSAASNTASCTTPWEAPTITTQPASQNVLVGANVTLTVAASGTPAPTYQWRKNGTAIPGATNTSYNIPKAARSDSGSYVVVVSNAGGTVYSNGAMLLVGTAGDTDGDGMPDSWESAHGLNPNDPNDAQLDPDGDGLTNVAEYNLGTNPTVADTGQSALGGTIPAGWPSAGDSSNPKAVGITGGQLSVDHSGAASYSVPIWTTPGTAGTEPHLSLGYSSQGGAGIAGFGWALSGVSQISRGPATRVVDGFIHGVDFSANDRFYLDGQRLIAISGADGADGTEYRTELDSFSKIVSHGVSGSGPAWFEVRTKAGLIIELGNTTDSAFDPSGSRGVLSWSVSKIRDTAGNYMTFTYTKNSAAGTQLLSRIDYTGNSVASTATYASVQLGYETRLDQASGYRAGCLVASTQRLKTVSSYYGATLARQYTLNYTTSGTSNRSLLSSITETGSDGSSYPDLTFTYETSTPTWQSQSGAPWTPPTSMVTAQGFNGSPTQYGTGFVDLDGDGRPDFVQNYWDAGTLTPTAHAWLNKPGGWVPAEDPNAIDFRPPYALGYSNNNDSSTRFIDFDGDGRPDILWYHVDGNGAISSGAYRNTGTGWASVPLYTPPFALARDKDTSSRGVHFLDLDGDGRVDLIANGAGNAYTNNGTQWVQATQWNAPCDLGHGAVFVDLNGDGLPDIVQSWYGNNTSQSGIWINNGNGWTYQGGLPAGFPLLNAGDPTWGQNSPMGTEFVDLNGDGLVDVIARNDAAGNYIAPQVWFNTGSGLVKATGTSYNPPVELRHDHESTGVSFLDLDGDGLVDLVQAYNGGAATVYYNTGTGWAAGAPVALNTIYLSGWKNQNQTDFVDIDADGLPDQVGSWTNNGVVQSVATRNASNPKQDRLKTVTNGFGVQAQIAYKPLTDATVYTKGSTAVWPDVDVISPLQVVSTVKNDDGKGGTYDVSYSYGGMRMNIDRGSQGFQWVSAVDSRTGIVSTAYFMQQFPYTGMPAQAVTKTSDGKVLSQAVTTYDKLTLNNGKTQVPYAHDVVQQSFDLSSATGQAVYVSGTDTVTQLDNYGNALTITVAGIDQNGSQTGFTKTTTCTYNNDTANWFLGRLLTSSVTSAAPGKPSLTRTSAYLYDPATGLLTDEAVEPVLTSANQLVASYQDTSGYGTNTLRTHYEYDSFGNKRAVRVSGLKVQVASDGTVTSTGILETRSTTSVYDANGRFASSTTNAVSQTETYNSYNQALGVVTRLTGPNGLATSWSYDGFGRSIQENHADGTVTTISRKWALAGAGPTPAGAKYQIETNASGAVPTMEFYDSFGRVVRTIGINGAGEIVYQDTQYDAMGRAYAKSNPYRNDGQTVYWTQTTSYDLLNRPLIVQTPNDEVTQGFVQTVFAYNGLVTSTTDARGHRAQTTKNAEGWVTGVIRNADASPAATDYSAVSYDYDALGQVTQTVAAGVTTTVHYDQRGRKDSMTDPDMGTWSYRYNAFGELIWQKDAKSQIATTTYDALGRMTVRSEAEGNSTWTYDSPWVGKIGSASSPGYSESYSYDLYGRLGTVTRNISGTAYAMTQTYDQYSRPLNTVYPTGFQTKNCYNAFGFVKEVRRADNGKNDVYWEADHYSPDGHVDGEMLGNGLVVDRVYSRATGQLRYAAIDLGIAVGDPSQSHSRPYGVQDLFYGHDAIGNVVTRNDAATNRNESFQYDGLDRLTAHTLSGVSTVSVQYDQAGNITSKSDVGSYAYNYTPAGRTNVLPHAVSAAGANGYQYDANGNMTSGAGRSIAWTSFNQASSISDGSGHSSTFTFDVAHQRVTQVASWGTTVYVGALFERVTRKDGVVENKHYIMSPTGRVAVRTERSDSSIETRFFHTDGLGSITAVSDEYGAIVQRFAFDAWGKRLTVDQNTGAWVAGTSANASGFTRGFTGHEQLDDLGLVHMNGRIYDPVLGRFLSADPTIDGTFDPQGYNRYTYVGNNPLGATDPTGYFKLKEILPAVIGIVVAVVATVVLGPGGATFWQAFVAGLHSFGAVVGAGAAGGFASGFSGSLLNGGSIGDAFKAGVVGAAFGAASAGVAYGIGQYFDGLYPAGTAGSDMTDPLIEGGRALAHGVSQGALAEAEGGQFRHGFYAAAFSSAAGSVVGHYMPGGGGIRIAERTAVAAVLAGTASVLGGGKFANGALTGAFEHMFNQEAEGIAERSALEEIEIERAEAELAEMEARHGIVRLPRNLRFRAASDHAEIDELFERAAEASQARWEALSKLFGPFEEVTGAKLAQLRSQFDAMRPELWKQEARVNPGNYTIDQLKAMSEGRTPTGWDGRPMEIHHFRALQYGGANVWSNFRFMTYTEHRNPMFWGFNHPPMNAPFR